MKSRIAALAIFVVASTAIPASAVATKAPASLRVGRLILRPCTTAPPWWCGSVAVPFDRTDPAAGTIGIGFMWFPARVSGPTLGTIVAEEGGPGYPSTGTRDVYLQLFAPLMDHRNLLLVDNRGTGLSDAIKCPTLQGFGGIPPSPAFLVAVRACANLLDHQRRRPDGSFVHGADLYGTANAARDLADVLAALDTGRVDLYGDSYGTWFSQTFASRYPQMLHSITLDSSYQVLQLLPWYVSTVTTARYAFNVACDRSVACARAAIEGHSWDRISRLVAQLRHAPLTGTTVDNFDRRVKVTVDVRALVNLVNDAGFDAGAYRELDAAARAYLERTDGVPLLRLTAQSIEFDEGSSGTYRQFSDGLYMAVACTDYPQLFRMGSSPGQRREQLAEKIAQLRNDTFAPFTTSEWIQVDSYTENYTACLDWPVPVHHDPPILIEPPLVPQSLPVLVLDGDLDSLTPTAHGGRLVTRQMGPSARFVSIPNTTHVAIQRDCASTLVRDFVADPSALFSLDTSCTKRIPEVRTVGVYPDILADETQAAPEPGNTAGAEALRLATASAAAVGDAIYRFSYVSGTKFTGLRGGTVTSSGTAVVVFHLNGVRWVDDVRLDGVARWDPAAGTVSAKVSAVDASGRRAILEISWSGSTPEAVASVAGSFGSEHVRVSLPAA